MMKFDDANDVRVESPRELHRVKLPRGEEAAALRKSIVVNKMPKVVVEEVEAHDDDGDPF